MRLATFSHAARALVVLSFLLTAGAAPTSAYAACGDGVFDDGEQCDDGNTLPGDCCDAECQFSGGETPCNDDGDSCTVDYCDGEGTCLHERRFGGSCDDGNPCTLGDFCSEEGFCISEGTAQDGQGCDNPNYCGGGGVCLDGACIGDPADCSGVAFVCQTAACNPDTGRCETAPAEDGAPCGRANRCYDVGKCESGECILSPKDCSAFADDCNNAACDLEVVGGCYSSPKEDGTGCNDGNGCTVQDTCTSGVCDGSPRDCSEFDDACNAGICNGDLGECEAAPREDGTSCNDGNLCTTADACSDGQCTGSAVDCSESGDACNAGSCDPETGECRTDPRENGTPCDDGDPCTTNDVCGNGECAGTPVDCSASSDACNLGVCNARTGQCEKQPVEEPASCSDGDACTTGDACSNGECTGTPVDCSASSDACNSGVCNPQNGQCEKQPLDGPTPCDDGNLCTTGDACSNGACAGTPTDCSASSDACNSGVCNPQNGQCEKQPLDGPAPCDDGNLCTTGDACSNGRCASTPVDCSGAGGVCTTGVCNPQNGQCDPAPKIDGTACSDGDLCTHSDQCTGGICAGSPIVCSGPRVGCEDDACDPQVGECAYGPIENGTVCDDGNNCTTGDQCTNGTCSGTPTDCSSLDDACNVGTCTNVGCVATPRQNGTSCNDGNLCTTGDQCTAGICGGSAVDCSGLDGPCHVGACNPQSGTCASVTSSDGTSCNDSAFCTKTDACVAGACVGSGNPCAGNAACLDVCDEGRDTCASAAGTACTNDANPCTDDTCDGEGSCVHTTNDTAACDDGLFCTTADRCEDGECVGDATCPRTEACGDTCNEDEHACRTCGHPFSERRCIVNAIFVLQAAVGLRECELCTCDVDASGTITTSDALRILKTCVNLPVALVCPDPQVSTTTTTTVTLTTL